LAVCNEQPLVMTIVRLVGGRCPLHSPRIVQTYYNIRIARLGHACAHLALQRYLDSSKCLKKTPVKGAFSAALNFLSHVIALGFLV